MRKPCEPVADTSTGSKLRRWGPIALPQLAAFAWALARPRNSSPERQDRFGRFAGIDTEKPARFDDPL
jgi:hypothetical protein